jgi:GPH family glycoside/pentoside/hexuronide:cation symporter
MTEMDSEKSGLRLREKLLFSTGDLSVSIPLTILMFFQLYFLTDIAGLRPDLAGWAVMAGRIWDAFNDPLMGMLCDRIRSRYGRRRVVLLFGAVPLGLSFILMWLVPPLGQGGLTVFYALTFILFDSMFTLIHVSYNALTPSMTPDYDERSVLNGYRMAFSIGGNLLAIIFATVLGWYVSNTRLLFVIVGVTLGFVTMIPPLIVFKITRAEAQDAVPEPLPAWKSLQLTLSNKPFLRVIGLYLFSWTTASILAAVLVYFANYYLNVPEQANYFVLVSQVCAIAFIPFWVWVSKKLDKRRAFILGMAGWIVSLGGIALIGPQQIALAYLLAALSGSGIATAYVLPWSMIPDIIELDELRSGQRREGSFYAFASFFQKLATGGAIWLLGQALAWTGYITPTQGLPLPNQPPRAVQAIRLTMGAVPLVLLILAIVLAWGYPITREAHRKLREALQERKAV